MNDQLSAAIEEFINKRKEARLEKVKKAEMKSTTQDEAANQDRLAAEAEKYEAGNWLDSACERAKQISLATHALKFTHPWAEGTSIYVQPSVSAGTQSAKYLGTSDLIQLSVDVVGNAAALDVAQLLQLEIDGYRLIDAIAKDDSAPLAPFARSPEQLSTWMRGFKAALNSKDPSSHTLAKQIYFPVAGDSYHVISPLFATSLAHALYQKVVDSRFSDEAKSARKARREGKYHPADIVEFPDTAIQAFGGTKPQNVSQLNSTRSGKAYLFSCRPPKWKTFLRPPANRSDGFWREYERRGASRMAKQLKDYLLEELDKSSTVERRQKRIDMVEDLIALLFDYAAEIQQLTHLAGWSADSKLPLHEQLWLDPLRNDPDFQALRQAKDWQSEVARHFASWLNNALRDDNLIMGDAEYREWKSICEDRISRLKEDLEIQSK